MRLYANGTKQTISLVGENQLQYREGKPKDRAYDSCFYEIHSADTMQRINHTEFEILNNETVKEQNGT